MPPGSGRSSLVHDVVFQTAIDDPVKALNWAEQLKDDQAVITAISMWATNDPAAAAHQVQSMADGSARQKAVQAIAEIWANSNPSAAVQWVTNLPDSPQKEMAYSDIAIGWVHSDPEEAEKWALSISDPAARDAQVTILQQRMKTAAASASAAVQKSSLPAEVKNQLLQFKP